MSVSYYGCTALQIEYRTYDRRRHACVNHTVCWCGRGELSLAMPPLPLDFALEEYFSFDNFLSTLQELSHGGVVESSVYSGGVLSYVARVLSHVIHGIHDPRCRLWCATHRISAVRGRNSCPGSSEYDHKLVNLRSRPRALHELRSAFLLCWAAAFCVACR